MTDLGLACCVIKIWENGLSGSVNLFKGVDVIDICTKLFCNFRRPSYRGSICPTGEKIGSSYRSFKKSRVREIGGEIIELEWNKSKGNKVWFEISGGLRNWGFKKSGFHCMLDHAKRLSSSPGLFCKECCDLRKMFLKLKYPVKLIDSIFKTFQASQDQNQSCIKPVDSPVLITLPFKDQKSADSVRRQLPGKRPRKENRSRVTTSFHK